MNRRRKKCHCCRDLYRPHPQTYRQQKTCDKPACRAWRRRRKWKRWQRKHPVRGEGYRAHQVTWRGKHRGYHRTWVKEHPGYVERNRQAQKKRNLEKRGMIVKPTEWKRVRREKLKRIRSLRLIVKPTEWRGVEGLALDGVLRYLEWAEMIVKPTDMDFPPPSVQNAPRRSKKRGGGARWKRDRSGRKGRRRVGSNCTSG